jgi:hypothetical protein
VVNLNDLPPLGISPEKAPVAIISMLLELTADMDTLSLRLDQLQRGETPSAEEIYSKFRRHAYDQARLSLLSKLGE